MNRMAAVIAGTLVGLIAIASALAQQTELTVSEGAVEVQTSHSTTKVQAGQAAKIEAKRIKVKIAEPLVEQLLALEPLVREEKKSGREKISHTSIQVHSIEGVASRKVAALIEVPNSGNKASSSVTLGPTGWDARAKVYSAEGKPLEFKVQSAVKSYILDGKPATEPAGSMVTVEYPSAVEPGGLYRLVMVLPNMEVPEIAPKAEGKLWRVAICNDTPDCLNYWRVILPKSAIYVGATLGPTAVECIDGRTVLTFRKYTGPRAEGTVIACFLWPEQDGGSLADLPGEYRGLEDLRAVGYRQKMSEIYGGKAFADQSTPVNALLSINSAMLRKDAEAMSQVGYAFASGRLKSDVLAAIWDVGQQMARGQEMLSTPDWPARPQEGYIHPIYMRGRDSSPIRVDTIAVIYSKGKWYYMGNMGNPNSTDVSVFKKFSEQQPTTGK